MNTLFSKADNLSKLERTRCCSGFCIQTIKGKKQARINTKFKSAISSKK
jgi:hypothetical protein